MSTETRAIDRPAVQVAMFIVLAVCVSLPVYTDVPEEWGGLGMIAWAAVLLKMVMPPLWRR